MMSDLIERQRAIELIHSLYPSAPIMRKNRELWEKKYKPYIEAEKALEQSPSAQPERKKGKWVGYDGDWLKTMCKCSECGAMIDINEKYRNFFCYHCGARMENNNESD